VPGPLFLVGDEGEFGDEGFELDRRVEGLDQPQVDPQGEDFVTELRGSGEYPGCILVDPRCDLEAPGDRRGKSGVLIDHLLPDVDELGVRRVLLC